MCADLIDKDDFAYTEEQLQEYKDEAIQRARSGIAYEAPYEVGPSAIPGTGLVGPLFVSVEDYSSISNERYARWRKLFQGGRASEALSRLRRIKNSPEDWNNCTTETRIRYLELEIRLLVELDEQSSDIRPLLMEIIRSSPDYSDLFLDALLLVRLEISESEGWRRYGEEQFSNF